MLDGSGCERGTHVKEKGIMIAIEGIDGSGKSTHIKYIAKTIKEKYNKEVVETREPGGTPMAEKLRSLVLAKGEEHISADAEVLMFNAARCIHVENLIKPALEEGKIVVSDRFSDSTFAYQCAHGADYDRIEKLTDWTLKGFVPNYTFFFFISPADAKSRVDKRKAKDRFDEETDDKTFVEKTSTVFLRRMNEGKSKYIIIDSSKTIEDTQMQIDQVLENIFNNKD